MELPTRSIRACLGALVLTIGMSAPASAQDSLTRVPTVTIRIGDFPVTQVVPVSAYQALLAQGLEVTVISRGSVAVRHAQRAAPAPRPVRAATAPQVARDVPLTMTGWAVGVFR